MNGDVINNVTEFKKTADKQAIKTYNNDNIIVTTITFQ